MDGKQGSSVRVRWRALELRANWWFVAGVAAGSGRRDAVISARMRGCVPKTCRRDGFLIRASVSKPVVRVTVWRVRIPSVRSFLPCSKTFPGRKRGTRMSGHATETWAAAVVSQLCPGTRAVCGVRFGASGDACGSQPEPGSWPRSRSPWRSPRPRAPRPGCVVDPAWPAAPFGHDFAFGDQGPRAMAADGQRIWVLGNQASVAGRAAC